MSVKSKNDCQFCESRESSLFCQLHAENLKKIDINKTCNVYKRGQIIFHQGNKPVGLFCVKSGKIKVYKTSTDGKEQIVRLVKEGEVLGYRSLIAEEIYSASASALEDSQICLIDRDNFFSVLKSDENLNWNFLKFLALELRNAEDLMADIAQKSVRERVAEVILLLKTKYGSSQEDGILNAHLTREDLASLVGTATETLIRLISDFKSQGIIETKGRKIKILNHDALVEIANIEY